VPTVSGVHPGPGPGVINRFQAKRVRGAGEGGEPLCRALLRARRRRSVTPAAGPRAALRRAAPRARAPRSIACSRRGRGLQDTGQRPPVQATGHRLRAGRVRMERAQTRGCRRDQARQGRGLTVPQVTEAPGAARRSPAHGIDRVMGGHGPGDQGAMGNRTAGVRPHELHCGSGLRCTAACPGAALPSPGGQPTPPTVGKMPRGKGGKGPLLPCRVGGGSLAQARWSLGWPKASARGGRR
jgi:hypothetical protein